MKGRRDTLLLLGSYNGQDSFGDKTLLRCAAAQGDRALGPGLRLVCHVANVAAGDERAFPGVELAEGFVRGFDGWRHRWNRLLLPRDIGLACAIGTYLPSLTVSASRRRLLGRIVRDLRRSRALYYFGGTQFSSQWFRLNLPPLLQTLVLARVFGVPVFFGPQQYGPQTPRQASVLRRVMRTFVRDVRARNGGCLALLGLPPEKELYDEVFSCRVQFPVRRTPSRQDGPILLNVRGTNFLEDGSETGYEGLGSFLSALHERTGRSFVVFQMSGDSFCDDAAFLRKLGGAIPAKIPIEIVSKLESDQELIDLAAAASGCVSMSFHGCILSMIAGCPAVPITSGGYYDYKYRDFGKYSGDAEHPILDLGSLCRNDAARVTGFFGRFDAGRVAEIREEAADRMDAWYLSVAERSLQE